MIFKKAIFNRLRNFLLTIEGRLLALVLITVCICSAGAYVLSIIYVGKSYFDNLKDNAHSIIITISPKIVEFKRKQYDTETGIEIARILQSFKFVEGFYIYSADGEPVLQSGRESPEPQWKENLNHLNYSQGQLSYSQGIIYNGRDYGSIILDLSVKPVIGQIKQFVISSFWIFSLLVLISVGLTLKFKAIIFARLVAIINEIHGTEGTGRHINVSHKGDEIEMLRNVYDALKHDITNIERQLEENNRLALIGEMAGGIAHEINTPLAVIMLTLESLDSSLKSGKFDIEKTRKKFQTSINTVARISKISASILALSSKNTDGQLHQISIGELFADALALTQGRFLKAGIRLDLDYGDKQIKVNCLSVQIVQVLVNLLNNSYDAVSGNKESWVSLKANRLENKIKFEVSDSGAGIDDGIIEKIMNPYFTTKEVGKGSGLGLSISKRIIDTHHGKMYYDKSSGYSCFIIELPV